MYARSLLRCVLRTGGMLLLGLLALPLPAGAQEPVGAIEELRQERGRRPVPTTDAVRLTSERYYRRAARQQDALHLNEIIELVQPYFVKAQLHYGETEALIVAGSSGSDGPVAFEQTGAYQIVSEGPVALGQVTLAVEHGNLLIRRASGRVRVLVSGVLAVLGGTTVLVAADSTAADAYFWLEEGHVTFPDFDIDVEGEGILWRLQEGLPPQRVEVDQPAREQFEQEVNHLGTGVWQDVRPFWQRPGFYVPAGLVLGGLIAVLVWPDSGYTVPGDVVVTIPD